MMERSEQIGDLAQALAKAQGAIKGAGKSKENPFFKSSYADLAAVMEACREALSKNNLAVVQSTQFDEARTWIETVLAHSTGQWISARYPVIPVKNDPQGFGSAVTYARRYSLMALVGIVAEDEDDDGNAASNRPQAEGARGNGNDHAKRPPAGDPRLAAINWSKAAQATLASFDTLKGLRAWDDKNQEALTRLKSIDLALFDNLTEIIAEQYARLSPLNA